MDNWSAIWDAKGTSDTLDVKQLDGYEDTTIDFKKVVDRIINLLDIEPADNILEVGCGAGGLAQYLQEYDYHGVDRSPYMLDKYLQVVGRSNTHQAEANQLDIPDKYYDHVIMFSVAQYFPDYGYFFKAEKELLRVARKSVFIGDLPEASKRDSHLLYSRRWFDTYNITDGFYNKDRFNVFKKV